MKETMNKVVTRDEWLTARKAFLAEEKKFTKLRDELARKRRELPWVKVEKNYVFEGPKGRESLADLFGKRSQLLVYHFMFSPDASAGCPHCSFWADNFNGIGVHLEQRDVSFVAISRAPFAKIEAFKKRMGWGFRWFSSAANEFNFDFGVSFTKEQVKNGTAIYNYTKVESDSPDREGISAFFKDGKGVVYHTYSCYSRGIDIVNGAYHFLDLAPKGRDEAGLEFTQAWVRHHDKYDR
jgi:predicted dithiol-disulfide oxidoreductase (DUF899 family)